MGSDNGVAPARPHNKTMPNGRRMREVLSYTRRGSRFTPRQAAGWEAHHREWVIPDEDVDRDDFAWTDWFGREAPLVVDIGGGIGEATAVLAKSRPEANILGLEVWKPGVADTLGRLGEAGVTNVRMCSVDAAWMMAERIAADSVAEVWTFFPDPWHKTKHHKRRLVDLDFAGLVTSRLQPGGTWRLATDWADYAQQMIEVLDATPGLEGGTVDRWDERPVTRFERKGLEKDRDITDLLYRRV